MIKRSLSNEPALLLIGCLMFGCQRSHPPTTAVPTPGPAAVSPPVATTLGKPTPPASDTPVQDAVNTLLSQQASSPHSLFPAGTKLLGADLKDGTVTLDFNSEFSKLANMGDSVEGAAQKALCAALAPIPNVEKLRVTVEGKPFDSQMADWNTPFPVRDEAERTAAKSNSDGGHE